MNLKQIEEVIWRWIVAPEGIAKAARDHPDWPLPITGNDRLSAEERLDIYANMYFYRILDSLKEDFSLVCEIVGEKKFHNLATDYLFQHPPTHFSLRYAGQHFMGFVKKTTLMAEWPFLAELALLEWLMIEAFDAPDQAPLKKEDLHKIPPAAFGDLKIQPLECWFVQDFLWPVDVIRENALAKQTGQGPIVKKNTTLMIWRKDLSVKVRRVRQEEINLFHRMRSGVLFQDLCAEAAKNNPPDVAAQTMASYLMGWIAEGFLAAPLLP